MSAVSLVPLLLRDVPVLERSEHVLEVALVTDERWAGI
jgi:hypothetical protein